MELYLFWGMWGFREGTALELAFNLCSLTLSLRGSTSLNMLAAFSLCSVDSRSVPLTWPTSGIEIHMLAPNQEVLGQGLEFSARRGSG